MTEIEGLIGCVGIAALGVTFWLLLRGQPAPASSDDVWRAPDGTCEHGYYACPQPPSVHRWMVYRCECGWRGENPKPSDQGPRCPLCGSLV